MWNLFKEVNHSHPLPLPPAGAFPSSLRFPGKFPFIWSPLFLRVKLRGALSPCLPGPLHEGLNPAMSGNSHHVLISRWVFQYSYVPGVGSFAFSFVIFCSGKEEWIFKKKNWILSSIMIKLQLSFLLSLTYTIFSVLLKSLSSPPPISPERPLPSGKGDIWILILYLRAKGGRPVEKLYSIQLRLYLGIQDLRVFLTI